MGARDSILSLDCFRPRGVFHRSQCYCGVESGVWESDRSFPNEFMSYPKLIYIFLEGCTIVQEGHTVLGSKMQQHHVQQKCTTPKPFVFPRAKRNKTENRGVKAKNQKKTTPTNAKMGLRM